MRILGRGFRERLPRRHHVATEKIGCSRCSLVRQNHVGIHRLIVMLIIKRELASKKPEPFAKQFLINIRFCVFLWD